MEKNTTIKKADNKIKSKNTVKRAVINPEKTKLKKESYGLDSQDIVKKAKKSNPKADMNNPNNPLYKEKCTNGFKGKEIKSDKSTKTIAMDHENSLKIIPLGGLNEIGKNLTAYEYKNDIIIVDCGLAFPNADMLGVDIVIPDFSYLEKNYDKIRGLVVTHGHEDHIGAIPYLLKKINVPIYSTKLTIGLIQGKLKEHNLLNKAKLNIVKNKDIIKLGVFNVECINVNHSIPDAICFAIHTPQGVVIHTGDFKIDYTPIEGDIINLARFAELGEQGVLCLLADSTNAERKGSTITERKVGQSFRSLFSSAMGKRIIIASFASNIHRVQQIMDCAVEFKRKVAVSGRSMEYVVDMAIQLGYLNVDKSVLISVDSVSSYSHEDVVIITTGSQGEPMAALSRMASGDHRQVSVSSDDFIIISATPIPGNEKHVNRVINELLKLGAEVIYEAMYEVHVSGHACQDELRLIQSLTKPKYFIPIHGEYKHLKAHGAIAKSLGLDDDKIYIGNIGDVIEFHKGKMCTEKTVQSGFILVDGLGVGDVGSIVLRDRKQLAQDGLIIIVLTLEGATGTIVAGPDIVSRGFVYVRESEVLMDDARKVVKSALEESISKNIKDWASLKNKAKDELSSYIYKKTRRSPMILPIIMEI